MTNDLSKVPSAQQRDLVYIRNLILNLSIAQLTSVEYCSLAKECLMIDPILRIWLKKYKCRLTARDIILCELYRMYKTTEEILLIFRIETGNLRTVKSRLRQRLKLTKQQDLENFLQKGLAEDLMDSN